MAIADKFKASLDASLRHKVIRERIDNFINTSKQFASDELKRKRFTLSWYKKVQEQGGLRKVTVEKATQTLHKINSGFFMKYAKTKIGKGGLILSGGIVAWNLTQHFLKNRGPSQPAIPRNYDRGYDILKENMTDFGSPVKLAKAANKIITPYKSAVRRGTYTTTRSVRNKNLSLSLYDNAIAHHHY